MQKRTVIPTIKRGITVRLFGMEKERKGRNQDPFRAEFQNAARKKWEPQVRLRGVWVRLMGVILCLGLP